MTYSSTIMGIYSWIFDGRKSISF